MLSSICGTVGLTTSSPSIRPMRTAATGPFQGMLEIISAVLAAMIAQHVNMVFLIVAEGGQDNLHIVAHVLGEQWAQGAVT